MYKALTISPMIPSYNIGETVNFFTGLFGFEIYRNGDYAIIHKDNLTIHILNAGTDIGKMEFYIAVDNIDALWDAIKHRLEGIKNRPPFNREYGMREFHIIVPHTKTLMFVGQALTNQD